MLKVKQPHKPNHNIKHKTPLRHKSPHHHPLQTPKRPTQITTRTPRLFSTTTNNDNIFGSLPPAPEKPAYQDVVEEMPNHINTQMSAGKKPILGMTLPEIETTLKELGMEKYRASQIFQWIYKKGATSFGEMTNLSKKQIALLENNFFLFPVDIKYAATATDGTRKYVIQVEKRGHERADTIETVYIPRIFQQLSAKQPVDKWDVDPDEGKSRGGNGDDDDESSIHVNANYDVSTMLNFEKQQKAFLNNKDQQEQQEETSAEAPALKQNHNPDNNPFIADFIPNNPDQPEYEYGAGTVCFSSQIGCSQSCNFCHTGSMPKSQMRNLTTGEIVGQILAVKHDLKDWPGKRPNGKDKPLVGNLVAMGQGEPGNNINNLIKALEILMHPDGLNLGRRHITVSTSGIVPGIDKLAKLPNPPNLAISLHATNDDLRTKIMPVNKQFPLDTLIAACRDYPGAKKTRKITFEYIMLNGVNDTDRDAYALLDLVEGIPSLVNCIPFNPWGNCAFDCSSMNRMRRFMDIINKSTPQTGVRATLRISRGSSESASCGTLNSKVSTELLKQRKVANAFNMDIKYAQQLENDTKNLPHLVHEATMKF